MKSQLALLGLIVLLHPAGQAFAGTALPGLASVGHAAAEAPYLVVLGVAQDGGVPQAGSVDHPGWTDPDFSRQVVSLGLVDPASGQRWLFDATPDLPLQLHELDEIAPVAASPGLAGIFLTHAHIGHYTGLMFLGHESLGAHDVPVYAMPRMAKFLRENGPWDQLLRYGNIELRELQVARPVVLTDTLQVTPILVPHRQEFSEVVGFRIDGPTRSVLFIPDIDSWETWDAEGTMIETLIAEVDVAYLDGTFHANGEIPGRDMSGFPHPFISHSVRRFSSLPAEQRAKIHFIHLNHSNPVLWSERPEHAAVLSAGYGVAVEGERQGL